MDSNLQKQLLEDFVVESAEGLDAFDRELLALEKQEGGAETMHNIFRVVHTIKGTAGCIGLARVEKLAHSAENVLTQLKRGTLPVTPDTISVLLRVSDRLAQMARVVESTGSDDGVSIDDLLGILEEVQAVPSDSATVSVAPTANAAFGLFEEEESAPSALAAPPVANAAWGLFEDDDASPAPTDEDAMLSAPVDAVVTKAMPRGAESAPRKAGGPPKASVIEGAIRVDVAQLDLLMNLVGELVLNRNQILASAARGDLAAMTGAAQRLNVITSELQQRVMKTRMQQIGNVWAKFPRTVRDLASELGKRVRLVMDGQTTELDRTIIEAIKDPLTHLVRNAIDHGLETPDIRRDAGKSAEGLLSIRAFHEGGQVNIEIMDDGRGINVERVRAKAVENGLLDAEKAARLTDREAMQLIFLPGFSTAEQVTNVSGRGVGMDVVRSNVEKTGGSIDIESQPGQGTTIRLKIPLTLAIIPALIVTTGGERFAIPQASLVELVRLERGKGGAAIEFIGTQPVYRLRGRLLPLVSLGHALRLHASAVASVADADVVNIVVLKADGQEYGVIVDAVNDTEEIVVKPLGRQLKAVALYAGATIMGDGRVALILDAMGLAQHAQVVEGAHERTLAAARATTEKNGERSADYLIFTLSSGRRMAIPLEAATRLEEFTPDRIEHAGAQPVVQYRGSLLPLVDVAAYVGDPAASRAKADTSWHVVVVAHGAESVGLVVERTDDIVSDTVTVRRESTAAGLLGSAVIAGRVTDLVDVAALVRSVAAPRAQSGPRIATAA